MTPRFSMPSLSDIMALISICILIVVLLAAIIPGRLAPHDPARQDLEINRTPPAWVSGGSSNHILGTDWLGRDLLSRIIYGARVSVQVALGATSLGILIGVTIGLVSGYAGGYWDGILMRFSDAQVAIPGLMLAMIMVSLAGASLLNLTIILGVIGWPVQSRMARGGVLTLKEELYVEAARALGLSPWSIIRRHILPHLVSILTPLFILELARVILAEASLSFLGLGIQAPNISWGLMLADGRNYMFASWWVVFFPGLAIALSVLSINQVSNWLQAKLHAS